MMVNQPNEMSRLLQQHDDGQGRVASSDSQNNTADFARSIRKPLS